MRHQNSVMHGLLKSVPWAIFDDLVEEHGADAGVRRLSTKSQLVALLHAQFSGTASLREIETAMSSHSAKLYHLGAREVSRSTADAARLIDSTGIRLAGIATEWAHYSKGVRGAKAHVIMIPTPIGRSRSCGHLA